MARSIKPGLAAFPAARPKKSGAAAIIIAVTLFVLLVVLIYVSGSGSKAGGSASFAPAPPNPTDSFPVFFVMVFGVFLVFSAMAWRFFA